MTMSLSHAAYRRALKVMPGGNTRTSNFEKPHPTYLVCGNGAYVTDVDGTRYLDFQNNFTTLIHGYGHPSVVNAIRRQAGLGLSFAGPTVAEIELAELLVERVSYFEQIRFTNTGSEAVMMAIKAARAYTGRDLIAKCDGAYHGNYDVVEANVTPLPLAGTERPTPKGEHSGVARSALSDCLIIPFNDIERTRKIIESAADRLAAIVVDPLPSRIGLIAISADYLTFLRNFTLRNSSLLIFDQVLSFRLGYGGAPVAKSNFPDLCAIGKIIGGGLPIGAVAGRTDIMAVFDPTRADRARVIHSGTFTANPLSMAAGLAAMTALPRSELDRLNVLGAQARNLIAEAFASAGIKGTVTGEGSLFRLFVGPEQVASYADTFASAHDPRLRSVVARMRERKVLLSSIGLGALSTPMTGTDIAYLAETLEEALRSLNSEPT